MSTTRVRHRRSPLHWLLAFLASVIAHFALMAVLWLWQMLIPPVLQDEPDEHAEAEPPAEGSERAAEEGSAEPADAPDDEERPAFEVVTIIEDNPVEEPDEAVAQLEPEATPEPEPEPPEPEQPEPENEPEPLPEPPEPEPMVAVAEPEPPAPEPPPVVPDMNRVSVDQLEYNDEMNLEAEFLGEQDNRVEEQTVAQETVLFDEYVESQQAGESRANAENAGEQAPETPAADDAAEVAGVVAGTTTAQGSAEARALNAEQTQPPADTQEPSPGERSNEPPRPAIAEQSEVVGQTAPSPTPPEMVPDEVAASDEIPTSDDGNVAQPEPAQSPFEAFTAAAAAQRAVAAQQAIGSEGSLVQRVVEQGDEAYEEVFGERNARDRERIAREVAEASLAGDHEGRWERTRGTLENFDVHVAAGSETALNTTSSPFAAYIHRVHNEIHPYWTGYLTRLSLTEGPGSPLSDQSLACTLEYVIDRNGAVADVRIVSQSREPMFTAEAVNMLYSLGPYPPPPAAMLSSDGNTYLHWRFQRDNRACGTFGASVHFVPGEGPVDEGK